MLYLKSIRKKPFQRGVALIISLVMLAAVTLIGVFVMGNSHLEWVMTSNSSFQSDANLRAYAAVRDGMTWIKGDFIHVAPPPPADPRIPANWEPTKPLATAPAATSITAPGINQYYVELMSCAQGSTPGGTPCGPAYCSLGNVCTYTYQVWGRASDSKGAERIVQATAIEQEGGSKFLGLHATYADITP